MVRIIPLDITITIKLAACSIVTDDPVLIIEASRCGNRDRIFPGEAAIVGLVHKYSCAIESFNGEGRNEPGVMLCIKGNCWIADAVIGARRGSIDRGAG